MRPHGVNLDGVFGLLANVVWTTAGPCAVEGFEQARAELRAVVPGHVVQVFGVDKFPRMTDYVLPTGVRIADADRVRLGAHLAEGTTVMHEGFVNFNAGTLGASMVEGRISAGVVVGDGSDVGGGASIMGTLSGGGKEVISVGERCLLGANAGIGISLGDDCVVEAGCYVTAGTKVTVPDMDGKPAVVKAAELSGADNMLFRRNSVSGAIEAVPWKGDGHRPQRRPARQLTGLRAVRCRTAAIGAVVALGRRRDRRGARATVAPCRPSSTPSGCTAEVDGHTVELDLEQAENAALIAAIAVERGLPARAATIALATAYQESKLHNIDYGDRDSARAVPAAALPGLGHASQQLIDPVLRDQRLLRRAGRRSTATRRWRSPRPPRRCSARASPRPTPTTRRTRRALASALTGNRARAFVVRRPGRRRRGGRRDSTTTGLVARAAVVRRDLETRFGALSLGGFEPGGVSSGHMEGSAHYEGRAIDVFVRPVTDENKQARLGDGVLPRRPRRPARRQDRDLRRPDLARRLALGRRLARLPRAVVRHAATGRSSSTATTCTSTSSTDAGRSSESPLERGFLLRTAVADLLQESGHPSESRQAERRATAAATRSSVAVKATRTCWRPAGP